MEDTVKDLLEKWHAFKISYRGKVDGLRFDYNKNKRLQEKRKDIIEALLLWEFIRIYLAGFGWDVRREFLGNFTSASNEIVRAIAMMESMPTLMFREILWRYNIDFMYYDRILQRFTQFESFLRRLDEDQMEAIGKNYADLFVFEEIPEVFTRFRRFFKKITVESLLAEEPDGLDYEKRYSRKGSWRKNMLDLDFGHNRYPKGELDDEDHIEYYLSTRFFSAVEMHHSDDFVVNTDFGKYWWFYKTARSSYAWFPNRVVELRTHICPGFWYTLFIHAMFWVLSPLADIGLGIFVASVGTSFPLVSLTSLLSVILCLACWVTPLWLLLAMLRLLTRILLPESRRNAINDWGSRNKEEIKTVILVIIVSFVLVFFGYFIVDLLRHGYGMVGALVITLGLYGYVISLLAHSDDDHLAGFGEYPLWVKVPLLAVVAYILVHSFVFQWGVFIGSVMVTVSVMLTLIKGFVVYAIIAAMFIWERIVAIASILWHFKVLFIILASPIILAFPITMLPERVAERYIDRIFYSDKVTRILFAILTVLIASVGILVAYDIYMQLFVYGNLWGGLITTGGIIFIIIYLMVLRYFAFHADPRARYTRKLLDTKRSAIKRMLDLKELYRNEWFRGLDREGKEAVISKLSLIIIYLGESGVSITACSRTISLIIRSMKDMELLDRITNGITEHCLTVMPLHNTQGKGFYQ